MRQDHSSLSTEPITAKPLHSAKLSPPTTLSEQFRVLAILSFVLCVCFALPLINLVRFALQSDLFSHILLIPAICGYLAWIKKSSLSLAAHPVRPLASIPIAAGLIVLGIYWFRGGPASPVPDRLTWPALSFVLCFIGISFFSLDLQNLRVLAFPIAFLFFLVPFPGFVIEGIETFLQHTSALAADVVFNLTGMSFLRDGLVFQLPGIRLQVAPECSGIHSTLVLFITSLVAGHLFLATGWKRAALGLAVIPLGILRNAIRIVTIGQLCVHISPEMINSPIHRRGGPLFFAVSLIPLFLLMYYLHRSELKNRRQSRANQMS